MTQRTCKTCGTELKRLEIKSLPDYDSDGMTEGQMADYMGAEESGMWGEWAETEIVYYCPKCKKKADS